MDFSFFKNTMSYITLLFKLDTFYGGDYAWAAFATWEWSLHRRSHYRVVLPHAPKLIGQLTYREAQSSEWKAPAHDTMTLHTYLLVSLIHAGR